MRNMYEIFDEFEMAESKKERMAIIGSNLSQTLVDVLKLTFHPDFQQISLNNTFFHVLFTFLILFSLYF